ncbi:MAG: hypothetical protein KC414_14310 [Romboutsia sp.]|nr:hypothetical protein [Romboutsia sp.]
MSCSQSLEPFKLKYLNVTKKLRVDLIEPYTPGGSIIIDGLDLACITLNDDNSFVGCNAGAAITTGTDNTLIGHNSGVATTTGSENTFLGDASGATNTTGSFNTFVGTLAGFSNTTAENNTFLGYRTGLLNTTGSENVFLGMYAGIANTTGARNTFSGHNSGARNTTGVNNAFMGTNSGYNVITGSNNTIVGYGAALNSGNAISGCVLLGTSAGANNSTDNRLMIDNSNTNEPLIDGDFSGNTLTLNGEVTLGDSTALQRPNLSAPQLVILEGSLVYSGSVVRIQVQGSQYLLKLYTDPTP